MKETGLKLVSSIKTESFLMTSNDIEEKYKKILTGYDKLEKLFKISQLAMHTFHIPVLNEYRYFSRAIVDYGKATNIQDRNKALSRAEVAIAAAYNDIIDSILHTIKSTVNDIRRNFWNVNTGKILSELNYDAVLTAIEKADKMIASSRENRESRFDKYVKFSETKEYDDLINFTLKLGELQYRCEIESNQSSEHREKELLDIIQKALEHNDEDSYPRFILHLQPKFNAQNLKELPSVEALIRLQIDDKSQLMFPNSFLDIAYKAYLEKDIGLWVLNKAVEVLNDFKSIGAINDSFDFSINIAPSQAGDASFTKDLRNTVIQNNIEKNLSLEITEDWIDETEQYKDVSYRLGELHKDTKVAIDDFGAGTTRIEYLANIENLNAIKIDKSLVDGLLTKNKIRSESLIKGILALAKQNNLKVIAEGIETEEQKNILIEIGVDQLQGYQLERPMSIESFKTKYLNCKLQK